VRLNNKKVRLNNKKVRLNNENDAPEWPRGKQVWQGWLLGARYHTIQVHTSLRKYLPRLTCTRVLSVVMFPRGVIWLAVKIPRFEKLKITSPYLHWYLDITNYVLSVDKHLLPFLTCSTSYPHLTSRKQLHSNQSKKRKEGKRISSRHLRHTHNSL